MQGSTREPAQNQISIYSSTRFHNAHVCYSTQRFSFSSSLSFAFLMTPMAGHSFRGLGRTGPPRVAVASGLRGGTDWERRKRSGRDAGSLSPASGGGCLGLGRHRYNDGGERLASKQVGPCATVRGRSVGRQPRPPPPTAFFERARRERDGLGRGDTPPKFVSLALLFWGPSLLSLSLLALTRATHYRHHYHHRASDSILVVPA